jgi:hypothetical protein
MLQLNYSLGAVEEIPVPGKLSSYKLDSGRVKISFSDCTATGWFPPLCYAVADILYRYFPKQNESAVTLLLTYDIESGVKWGQVRIALNKDALNLLKRAAVDRPYEFELFLDKVAFVERPAPLPPTLKTSI